jgi:succinoglycan biosynthesis transport protein ExoP
VTEHQPDLRQYLRVLRRQGWLIALVTVLALGAAAVVSELQTPVYRASMKVVVGQGGGVFQAQFGGSVEPFARTMANLFESDVVARKAIDDLHLRMTPRQLLARVHVSSRPQSSVLEVSYDTPARAQAVPILADLGRVFTRLVKQKLGEPRTTGSAPISASVFDPAHLEPGWVSPRRVRNLFFAGVLGLAVGLVLAFVRESLDDRIRSRRDAERWFGAPVLGALPKGIRAAGAAPGNGGALSLEAMSMLRANLEFLGGGVGGPLIVVTSALPEEGKTTLVAHLGVALASAGNRVICVEADVRRPRLSEYLTATAVEHGLVDVIEGRVELTDALVELPLQAGANGAGPGGRLHVLPAGKARTNPADVLTAERVEKLTEDLRGRADYVIFDAPPILLVGDVFPFARATDNVIVVAREGRTTKEAADAVRVTLERLAIEHVGVVLTDWRSSGGYGYGYPATTSI